MTVRELLLAMTSAFSGFDANAVTAMAPVFQRKLERYEGAELANAWIEVAAAFRPTASNKYPAPAAYEEVLPRAARMPKGSAAGPLDLKAHAERKGRLVSDWVQWQRPAISQAFGERVAFWCEFEVRRRAQLLAWAIDGAESVRLVDKDVDKILASVVSRDRMDAFGAGILGRADGFDAWRDQMTQCREHVLAGRYSRDEIPQAERTARPKRSGPVFELRPDEWAPVPEVPAWLDDGAPAPDPGAWDG